jgi:hypothetical protein
VPATYNRYDPKEGDLVKLNRLDSRLGWRDPMERAMGGIQALVLMVSEDRSCMSILVNHGPYAGTVIRWPTIDSYVISRPNV